MTIQGIQVPMYTKHTVFVFFFIFQFFFKFYEKQNKAKMKTDKQKHVKQRKV